MRGTLQRRPKRHLPPGIIPAYAGNTHGTVFLSLVEGDHPRVCGEHTAGSSDITATLGSSPRMRGTLGFHEIILDYAGIIPAYAGNTISKLTRALFHKDHPRVCGEH